MSRALSGRLRRVGAALGLAVATGVFVAVWAVLALLAATIGGPALVELGRFLAGL